MSSSLRLSANSALTPERLQRRGHYWAAFILAFILLSAAWLESTHLGHRSITYWDESFHALVARNLLKHPLKFTLIDQPWLPYDYKNWGGNYIWLHKPPLPMWLIALSYVLFGVSALALRLPSLLFSLGAVVLTYHIGKTLFDERAGLIAAFWQAFNPCVYRLVHGYLFSDHIDIALLFWVEASCYLLLRALRTGSTRDYLLCGVAQGLGYLSKSYLGLLAFGIAFAIWLLRRIGFLPEDAVRIRWRHLALQLGALLITVAPWTVYAWIKYPREFLHENWYVLIHLNTDIESWGATWDRPLFDYMLSVVPFIYSGAIAASLLLIIPSVRHRSWQEMFLLLWAFGVVVPHSIATTKTPSATLIAMPALLLAFSLIFSRGFRDSAYAALWMTMGIVLLAFPGGKNHVTGRDQFDSVQAFAPYLSANRWILVRILGIMILGGGAAWLTRWVRRWRWGRMFHWGMVGIAMVFTVWLGARTVQEAKVVTDINADDTTYLRLGAAIDERFPRNACFFLDEPEGPHQRLMFYADRTVYPKGTRDLETDADLVKSNGGIPYFITKSEQALPLIFDHSTETGYRVYALDF